jgi:ribonuclease E
MPEAAREEPAAAAGRGREDGGRRGRGRRGRGGRREGHRERVNGSSRPDMGSSSGAKEDRSDFALTLARAFQLMSQALSEFRSPVGQEALRLRMVAIHGREDPLLDAARFPRLLRQANDAEVAEVRKVGDDDYEISAQRPGARLALPPAPPQESAAPVVAADAPADSTAGRENGQRLGVRFRRGSRGAVRPGEIPLIGVVRMEPPAEPVAEAVPAEAIPEVVEPPSKRPRPRRQPRKPAAAEAAPEPPGDTSGEPTPVKRPRARSRKKPE